jgi:hypothetical protein
VSDATQDDMVPVSQETGQQPTLASDGKASKRVASSVPLQSLAPRYEEEHHATYVARLEEAVKDPKSLNIALTGRYGSGKSSVLNEFAAKHERRTLRLAISTLAPEEPATQKSKVVLGAPQGTTNRIQKEVVKQLVYGASQKVGKNSRFSRIAVPSKTKVFAQFALAIALIGAVVFALDRLPTLRTFVEGQPSWTPYAVWVGFGAVAAYLLMLVRVALHGQIRIADVKAGGAAVSLTEQAPSYFDKYLDELVHYFDQESKDIVIFEDLDRFDDPQIFEALRELNILLNDTPDRQRRRKGNRLGRTIAWALDLLPGDQVGKACRKLSMEWGARLLGTGVPLRFVYAVKDSMFEKLGKDTVALANEGDAAAAETLRANRTKFFDIVVPLVPFISHRNARELLDDLLKTVGIHNDIDRRLQSIVARHATDMRLLRNICNEYLVFAEKLLDSDKVAPRLDPSLLFALVAYKNFHLADFELIARRGSVLDKLYDAKTALVRDEIAKHKAAIRELLAQPAAKQHAALALQLGTRLVEVGRAGKSGAGYPGSKPPLQFTAGGTGYAEDAVTSYEFWAAVVEHGQIDTSLPNGRNWTLTREQLDRFLPELGDPSAWRKTDEDVRRGEVASLEALVEEYRGADFKSLISLTAGFAAQEDGSRQPFVETINSIVKSDLARDLVGGGFIDQNFTLYAAQFYGTFVGVDVANFMVHNVQQNAMTVDYKFETPGAVRNLLAEADEDFLDTVAAYNIDVVDYLLETENPGLTRVITRLVSNHDDDARAFLTGFFTSNARREELAAELSRHPWRDVFTYLTDNEDVPNDVRARLVSAALVAADPDAGYALGDGVRTYIQHHYLTMPAFTEEQSPETASAVGSVAARADVSIPVLDAVLDLRLRRIFVKSSRYKLIAANLRTAIGQEGVGPIDLDHLSVDELVLEYCLAHPGVYLDLVEEDDETRWTVISPQVLADVLNAVFGQDNGQLAEAWTPESLERLLTLAGVGSSLLSLYEAPTPAWPALAAAGLFSPTLSNLYAYQAAFEVDDALAAHLRASGLALADDGALGDDEKEGAVLALLNSTTLEAHERVALVESLGYTGPVPVELIRAERDDLFGLLLRAGLVADEPVSFEHFRAAGWPSIGPAVEASNDIATFMEPDLLPGMVDHLLGHPACADKVGHLIVENLDEYLPPRDDDGYASALGALGHYALQHETRLSPDVIVRIAAAKTLGHADVLRLLRTAEPAATPGDIVAVFRELGGDYARVDTPDDAFELPNDDTHDELLRVLKDHDLVRSRKAKDQIKVRVIRAL